MKKRIGIALMFGMLLVMGMTGCQKNEVKVEEEKNDSVKTEQVSNVDVEMKAENGIETSLLLDQLPEGYSYEDALEDSLFIISDMKVVSGKEKWDDFILAVSEGKNASILIGEYYELGDESHYEKEYYESIKSEYPQFYMKELSYDGTSYRYVTYEDGKKYEWEYPYLIERCGMLSNAAVAMNGFFLVKEPDVTFDDLMWAVFSSNSADWIDYKTVFMEEMDKEEYQKQIKD